MEGFLALRSMVDEPSDLPRSNMTILRLMFIFPDSKLVTYVLICFSHPYRAIKYLANAPGISGYQNYT